MRAGRSGELSKAEMLAGLDEITAGWREQVFGLGPSPEPEAHPLEARPLAEGLRAIAAAPLPPGSAYKQLMQWSKPRGYLGYASVYEDPTDLLGSWLPTWRKGLYVSTSITSGGAALDPSLTQREIVAQNTSIAEDLTTQIIADHNFDPRDVLLSTDLPHVKGWKQSDYLIFWLMCLEGVPLDICEEFAAKLQERAAEIGVDSKHAEYEERWARYSQLVEDFLALGARYVLYNRNDYYLQTAGVRQLVQLVDASRSLGCRAEALYARRRGIKVLTFELNTTALDSVLRSRVARLTAMGARIGQRATRATQLVLA